MSSGMSFATSWLHLPADTFLGEHIKNHGHIQLSFSSAYRKKKPVADSHRELPQAKPLGIVSKGEMPNYSRKRDPRLSGVIKHYSATPQKPVI